MSKNNITGDEIKSKINTKEFEENFDRIFRGESKANKSKVGCPNASSSTGCFCTGECKEGWDEKRIDTIGSNGNTGEHYADPDAAYQQVEKDYNK